ncbi:disulfide bond formation protein B [Priestia filamentosa]
MKKINLFLIPWLISTFATSGSLYFSEVMKFTPCTLCWYQ